MRVVVMFVAACLWHLFAEAQEITERIEKVAVKIVDRYGKRIERDITVTVFEVAGRASYPLLILSHGRAADPIGRAKLGRAEGYFRVSRGFALRGYSVWVPVRIGYGASGTDEDPEDTGSCAAKHYEPGYRVATDQTLQVVEYARNRPEIDGRRVISLGHSFGGMTSVAVAARDAPGVVAAINFAGGGGANPGSRAGEPCATEKLRQLFGTYGQTSRVPTLWIYSENDRWFAPEHAKAWFDAYRSNGGTGEYVLLAPPGDDGHNLFTGNPALWRPIVDRFLQHVESGAGK